MNKLSLLFSVMLLMSVFVTGQFGFDPNAPNQGPQDSFYDPFGGPQNGPDPFAEPNDFGQQNYRRPEPNNDFGNQGPQGGFGFEGDRLGFDFGGFDVTQSDIGGGGVHLVTLKMSNALLRAMNESKSDFKNACLDGKQEDLISRISSAYESNKGSVQEICNRYNQRVQNFNSDICDPTKGMNLPLPRDMQQAATEAGVELSFDSDASSFERVCNIVAKKKMEQETGFAEERFADQAERFLEGCERIKESEAQREEMDKQRREQEKRMWENNQNQWNQGPPTHPNNSQQNWPQGPQGGYPPGDNGGYPGQPPNGDGSYPPSGDGSNDQQQDDGSSSGDGETPPSDDGSGEGQGLAGNFNLTNNGAIYFQDQPSDVSYPSGSTGPGFGPPQGEPGFGGPFGGPNNFPQNGQPDYRMPPQGQNPSGFPGDFGGQGFGGQGQGFGGPGGGYHMGPFNESDCESSVDVLVEKMKEEQSGFGPSEEMIGSMCKQMAVQISDRLFEFNERREINKETCELQLERKKSALDEAAQTCNDVISGDKALELIRKAVENKCSLIKLKEDRNAQISKSMEAALGLLELSEELGSQTDNTVVEASALSIAEQEQEFEDSKKENVDFFKYLLGSKEHAEKTQDVAKVLQERKEDLEDVKDSLSGGSADDLEKEIEILEKSIEEKEKIADSHEGGILSRLGAIIGGLG